MEDIMICAGCLVGLIFGILVFWKNQSKTEENRGEVEIPPTSQDLLEEFEDGFYYEVCFSDKTYRNTNIYMVLLEGSRWESAEIMPVYLKTTDGKILEEAGYFHNGCFIEGTQLDILDVEFDLGMESSEIKIA